MDEELVLEPGRILLGKYRIEGKIGEGGIAVIYKAIHLALKGTPAPVVLKVIKPQLVSSPEIVRQFAQETSVGQALKHPNIVEFIDMGEEDEMLMMVLEYVAGKDLGALVHRISRARRVLRPEIIAWVAAEVCKALECSHNHFTPSGVLAPVIHRDVSPQNIMLAFDGRVKLADFGMARALNMARQTQYGVIKGKLSYMSPEQSTGADVDATSDIFSLGVVMWESLCARRLFLKKKQIETIIAVRDAVVPPLSKQAPHVPAELAAIVHQSLMKEKEERYQSATQMRLALQSFLKNVEPVNADALSGVLAAFFPEEHEAAMAAEPALSFDDETDDARSFDIDDAPPPVAGAPAGLVAVHTIVVDRESSPDGQHLRVASGRASDPGRRSQSVPRTDQVRPAPSGSHAVGLQQPRTPQSGAHAVGLQQSRTPQSGAHAVGLQQPRTPQSGAHAVGLQQPRTPQSGAHAVGPPQHASPAGGWPQQQAPRQGGWAPQAPAQWPQQQAPQQGGWAPQAPAQWPQQQAPQQGGWAQQAYGQWPPPAPQAQPPVMPAQRRSSNWVLFLLIFFLGATFLGVMAFLVVLLMTQ
jgi:serine/threonine-protein kinase